MRMARAALGWGVRELAEKAGVTANTVSRIELGADAKQSTIVAIKAAFESAGVIFVAENGEGAGVRLRKTHSHEALTRKIDAIDAHLETAILEQTPSPARGMQLLERGHKAEVSKKLKQRRAKLEDKA